MIRGNDTECIRTCTQAVLHDKQFNNWQNKLFHLNTIDNNNKPSDNYHCLRHDLAGAQKQSRAHSPEYTALQPQPRQQRTGQMRCTHNLSSSSSTTK